MLCCLLVVLLKKLFVLGFRLNKGIRNDQLAESDWFVDKSASYHKSVFRNIGEVSA